MITSPQPLKPISEGSNRRDSERERERERAERDRSCADLGACVRVCGLPAAGSQ